MDNAAKILTGVVDLSYYTQSHRNYFNKSVQTDYECRQSVFLNGECKISISRYFREPLQSIPPKRSGGVIQNGLSNKGKAKIKFACRILQHHKKTFSTFVTLTYGKEHPAHEIAKNHLDIFLKRQRRRFGNFQYVWVSELQKRGAIHFHLCFNEYLPKVDLNKDWNAIVSKWQKKNGHTAQIVRPNIRAIEDVGSYMAKYISKDGNKICGNLYNISQSLRADMKPIYANINLIAKEDVQEVLQLATMIKCNSLNNKRQSVYFEKRNEEIDRIDIWISKINNYNYDTFTKQMRTLCKRIHKEKRTAKILLSSLPTSSTLQTQHRPTNTATNTLKPFRKYDIEASN